MGLCAGVDGGVAIMSVHPNESLVGIEGEVKWFDARKGYGFIIGPDDQDIMVHYSAIRGPGYRFLRDGATVEYDAEQTERGWKATRVVRVSSVGTTDGKAARRTTQR